MSLDQFVQVVTQLSFLLLGVIALADFIRQRTRTRLDIALLFGVFAAIIVLQEYSAFIAARGAWLGRINSILLLAHPYLLLRVAQHFRPSPARATGLALAGLLVSWAAVIAFSPLPILLTLMITAYFLVVEGYAALAFIRGALNTRGITHWRLLLAAIGSGMIAGLILLAGANALFPSAANVTLPLSGFLGLLSGFSYYLGFATPRWLRRVWQQSELLGFLNLVAERVAANRIEQVPDILCTRADRAVGGLSSLVLLQDPATRQMIVRASSPGKLSGPVLDPNGVLDKAWRAGQARLVDVPQELWPAREWDVAGARSAAVVPIATSERKWGLLVVFLARVPLFVADDLSLLSLLADQAAIALSYAALVSDQRALIEVLQQRTGQLERVNRELEAEREALRTAHEELEKRVQERTADLLQVNQALSAEVAMRQDVEQQLRQQATALEAANRELEAFSYSISHDLRAPLRAMNGFSGMLEQQYAVQLPAEGRHYLQVVRANSQKMSELIDDLLSFSRLGRQAVRKEPVAMADLARECLDDLMVEQNGRPVHIILNDLPACQADPALLKQVLMNLLSNALKFTRQRDPAVIEIGCQQDGQTPGIVYFVRDNGVGFDMRYAHKLFGVFQRLHRAEEYEGTGVGLAIVQRIVHRHGGRVWAESEPGQGTTFYFTL